MSGSVNDYGGYVDSRYLDASSELLTRVEQRSRELLDLTRGDSLLDVGCGPGIDTVGVAAVVGESGRIVGVDFDQEMVGEAQRRATENGVDGWVKHLVADATDLPFADGTFSRVRSERMLQHLDRPEKAVEEMVRVAVPGGRTVLIDTDWASLSIDSEHVDIERRLVRHKCETLTRNGAAGRQLYRLLRTTGLTDITVEPIALFGGFELLKAVAMWDALVASAVEAGVVTDVEVATITSELEERDRSGRSFGTLTVCIAAGSKL